MMPQEFSLNDMAKSVVGWMDGWCIQETKPMTMIVRDGRMPLTLSQLHESLDVIREVEESIKNELLKYSYVQSLWDEIKTSHLDNRLGVQEDERGWLIGTADPETRLRAIYKTLKGAGEINE